MGLNSENGGKTFVNGVNVGDLSFGELLFVEEIPFSGVEGAPGWVTGPTPGSFEVEVGD